MTKSNVAEGLFERYLCENGYTFHPIPRDPGKKTADYRVDTPRGGVYCEVKSMVWTEEDDRLAGTGAWMGQPGEKTFRKRLHMGAEKSARYAGHPYMVVFHAAVLRVLLGGFYTAVASLDVLKLHHDVSAVAILEEYDPHRPLVRQLVDVRHASTKELLDAHIRVAAEHPELRSSLLRLDVVENPAAHTPLPRDVFRGMYDKRSAWTEGGDGLLHFEQVFGPSD